MTKVNASTLTPQNLAKAKRQNRFFSGWVYQTAKQASDAKAAANVAKPKGKAVKKPVQRKVNSSAIFWQNYPGPRENVDHLSVTDSSVAWYVDRKCVLPISGTTTSRAQFSSVAPPIPSEYEVTGLKITFEAGMFPREVKIQALVLLAKTVADSTLLEWDTIKAVKTCKWFADVQSIEQSYKIPITRPINSGGEADEACLIVLFRAIDATISTSEKLKVTLTVTTSQLKAGTSSLDF